MTRAPSREEMFDGLIRDVRDCVQCERMNDSCRIFGHSSGRASSKLMFIGEAPGRLGADGTSIPFHGDRAGENFERLLAQAGISRYDCFITNAVLCNPKDDAGNNATPSAVELKNCSAFLARQIGLVDPEIIVTLGNQALTGLRLIEDHSIQLSIGVRKVWSWNNRRLIPLYHPGQRAMLHRSFLNQLADYRFVYEQLSKSQGRAAKKRTSGKTNVDVARVARVILELSGEISYFRLHELFYLVEYHHTRRYNRRLTRSYVVRQKDGPYFTDLHLSKLKNSLNDIAVREKGGRILLSIAPTSDLFESAEKSIIDELTSFIATILDRYRGRSDEELKTAVYLTSPMRKILRNEKYKRQNLFNAPIEFLLQPAAASLASASGGDEV